MVRGSRHCALKDSRSSSRGTRMAGSINLGFAAHYTEGCSPCEIKSSGCPWIATSKSPTVGEMGVLQDGKQTGPWYSHTTCDMI